MEIALVRRWVGLQGCGKIYTGDMGFIKTEDPRTKWSGGNIDKYSCTTQYSAKCKNEKIEREKKLLAPFKEKKVTA